MKRKEDAKKLNTIVKCFTLNIHTHKDTTFFYIKLILEKRGI